MEGENLNELQNFSATQCNAQCASSMTTVHCTTCDEEFFHDEWNQHTCSNIPPAYSYQRMICTDEIINQSFEVSATN